MENSKKLIVYYSYTRHTKIIAENIQKKFGMWYPRDKASKTIFYKLSNSCRWGIK